MPMHTMIEGDPLWVPILTHYREGGEIDHSRMAEHLNHVSPFVTQVMLAGSTGDGWELDDRRFGDLIDFAVEQAGSNLRIMFGALAPDTEAVVARIKLVEDRVSREPRLRESYVGATVCPPIDPEASQSGILAHYESVMDQTFSNISVYQLPQITGCKLAPETVRRIAEDPRVIMFKDSSGADEIAASGLDFSPVVMLRGAEGGYAEAVTQGAYGGWLLSTANVFGGPLRQIEGALRSGRLDDAVTLSQQLSAMVLQLFDAAADETGANAFSNANRAADHLAAHGKLWNDAPLPFKQDGQPLSSSLVAKAAEICGDFNSIPGVGYLDT